MNDGTVSSQNENYSRNTTTNLLPKKKLTLQPQSEGHGFPCYEPTFS